MECSSYNSYDSSSINNYVLFLRSNDLIYIETLFLSATITSHDLCNNKFLYGYYLLSLAFTKNPKKILFMEKGINLGLFHTSRKWCVLSNIHRKEEYYIPGTYSGFDTNPYDRILQLSYPEEINTFLQYFKEDFKTCPYTILNSFIHYEIKEISEELQKQENQIKAADVLITIFPFDIAVMIFNNYLL